MSTKTMALCCRTISKFAVIGLSLIPSAVGFTQKRAPAEAGQNNQTININRGIALQINLDGNNSSDKQSHAGYKIADKITIELGVLQKWTFPTSFFQKASKVPFPVSLAGAPPLFLQLRDGYLYIDTEVKDAAGNIKATIFDNRVTVDAKDWDVNFSDAAIEIVNGQKQPVFQIVRKRPDLLFVYSRFQNKGAIFDTTPLERVFLYPAWKYPGQYAPTSAPKLVDLSALDDASLIKRTNEYISSLNLMKNSYDQKLKEIHVSVSKDPKINHSAAHAAEDSKFSKLLKDTSGEERSIEGELTKRIAERHGAANSIAQPPEVEELIIIGPSSFQSIEGYLVSLERALGN